jgi:hypothetical protein
VPLSTPEPYKVDGYDKLLEAVKLGGRRKAKVRDFVPKMYQTLVAIDGLAPQDAEDRIYRDLLGIWKKETVRRFLPSKAKGLAAREMQAASRAKSSVAATPGVIPPKGIAIGSGEEAPAGLKWEIS